MNYFQPSQNLTLHAIDDIKFDFNYGFRIIFPETIKCDYRILLTDDYGAELLNFKIQKEEFLKLSNNQPFELEYDKKYFIKYKLYIFRNENKDPDFSYNMDLTDKNVFIQCNVNAIGDNVAWMGIFDKFRQIHKCKLFLFLEDRFVKIFKDQYPEIHFVGSVEYKNFTFYATYYIDANFEKIANFFPIPMTFSGVQKYAYHILGMKPPRYGDEEKPKLNLSKERQIKDPYVCISVKASYLRKMWVYPNGWEKVIEYLKSIGYRVFCVDKEKEEKYGDYISKIPEGAEDFTGDLPLQDRIDLIKDADFFIGLDSGLSWIAWGCNIPVVLITGFSYEASMFYTPYKLYSYTGCCCCANKENRKSIGAYEKEKGYCPNQENLSRPFECQLNVSPKMVIETINEIPIVKSRIKNLH